MKTGSELQAALKNGGTRPGRRSDNQLQTMAAARDISVDAATETVLSQLDGTFMLKEEQQRLERLSSAICCLPDGYWR